MRKLNYAARRVLIVASGSLLEEGMGSLLKRADDLQVSDIAYTDDTTFLQDLSDIRPDVILLNETGALDSVRILELLKGLPTLATLRVIVVRSDDNMIDVYERRRVATTQSADLIATVRRGKE